MKNFIMGIAMILLCSIFMVFQNDINQMQREQQYIKQVAEETAATAALYYEEGNNTSLTSYDFANGYIKFMPTAGPKGMELARQCLKLSDTRKSSRKYYGDNVFYIEIYTFSMDGTYQKFVNGVSSRTGTFQFGKDISTYMDEPYKSKLAALPANQKITIQYPMTMAVIDAGEPNIKDSLHLNTSHTKILKVGTYEYKDFEMR